MMLPFAAMLLAIAFMPFLFAHHWERFYHRWAVLLASISLFYYLLCSHQPGRVLHTAHDYLGFMALTASLFVIAGGIQIVVKGEAKPWVNVLFLLAGSVLSNLIGTTGASMLLIRPWIRMNKYRVTGFHIVFFIFIISNVSGCLTPIGDPPLFLGYLQGVPFWWVLQHCWQAWLAGVGILVAIFFVFDWFNYLKAPKAVRELETARETWQFRGLPNLFFLAVVVAAVFINKPPLLREALMIGAAVASYYTTQKEIHKANDFQLAPIIEVGWLFFGLFGTMMPAIDYLQAHAASLGLRTEMQFYWGTGALSGVLDSAPAYLAFLAAAFGLHGLAADTGMREFIALHGGSLIAISIGSVFFGALTYLGNGPNLMVKAIAERAKVETPGFLGYLVRYSLPILLPLLFLVGILFFSRQGMN
jgi:Na+/H+ antiporter NhaD/arsenite permease-like protein